MLTADQVKEIINYTAEDLTLLIQERYTTDSFLTAEFLGVNNNSKFVFSATWYNEDDECDETTKVFVGRYNGLIGADY